MPDEAFDQLVAAQLIVDACNRRFRALLALINADDADVRANAQREWSEVFDRHAAARATIEEVQRSHA